MPKAKKYPDQFYPYVQGLTGRIMSIVGEKAPAVRDMKDSKMIELIRAIEDCLIDEVHFVEDE